MQGTCSIPVDTRVQRPAVMIGQYLCGHAGFHGTLHNSVQMRYLSAYTAGISCWVCQVCTYSVSPFSNNKELVNYISTVHCISKTQFRSMLTVVEYRTQFLCFYLKNGFHLAGSNSFKAVILFTPFSKTLATSTPKFLRDD
jgi:hypothetical protein